MASALGISAAGAAMLAPFAGRRLGKKMAALCCGLLSVCVAPTPVLLRLYTNVLPPNRTEHLFIITTCFSVVETGLTISMQVPVRVGVQASR